MLPCMCATVTVSATVYVLHYRANMALNHTFSSASIFALTHTTEAVTTTDVLCLWATRVHPRASGVDRRARQVPLKFTLIDLGSGYGWCVHEHKPHVKYIPTTERVWVVVRARTYVCARRIQSIGRTALSKVWARS